MGKADKLLFVLVTALIFLSIVWFAHLSQAQMKLTITGATCQILDATKADNAESMNIRFQRSTSYGTCLDRQPRKS